MKKFLLSLSCILMMLIMGIFHISAKNKNLDVNPFFIGNMIVDEDNLKDIVNQCEYYNFAMTDSTDTSCRFISPDGSRIVYMHPSHSSMSDNGGTIPFQSKVEVTIPKDNKSLKDMLVTCGFRKKNGVYTRKSIRKRCDITCRQTKSNPKTLLFVTNEIHTSD